MDYAVHSETERLEDSQQQNNESAFGESPKASLSGREDKRDIRRETGRETREEKNPLDCLRVVRF